MNLISVLLDLVTREPRPNVLIGSAGRLDSNTAREAKMAHPEGLLPGSDHDVTGLLRAWGGGDSAARDELVAVVYQELRRRAAARLRRERPGHLLQPTALVHEAYLRLVDQRHSDWQNRAHFFALASEMMRRILVDQARRRKMGKRSGGWARMTLEENAAQIDPRDVDLLDLDAALAELASLDLPGAAWPSSDFRRPVARGRRTLGGTITRDGGARLAARAGLALPPSHQSAGRR